jgi:hypothetical protein
MLLVDMDEISLSKLIYIEKYFTKKISVNNTVYFED